MTYTYKKKLVFNSLGRERGIRPGILLGRACAIEQESPCFNQNKSLRNMLENALFSHE